jgi:hypothetical protein
MQVVSENPDRVEEARAWLLKHKEETGMSWPALGRLTSNGNTTLSLFSSDTYKGDNAKVASTILAYRDRIAAQADIGADLPPVPMWFDTKTSKALRNHLVYAQSGKIVLIVTVPGIGKTKMAERFASADPNVWLATMSPATAGVATMASEVAEALGLGLVTGSPHQLSRKIREFLNGRKGLIIIDEAQELTDKALNEIRGWHDRTGVGIALLGNDKVIGQFDSRKSALSQISSRFSHRFVADSPETADIDACLEAWGITGGQQRSYLRQIGMMAGALRELTHTIEFAQLLADKPASMLSAGEFHAAAKARNPKLGRA